MRLNQPSLYSHIASCWCVNLAGVDQQVITETKQSEDNDDEQHEENEEEDNDLEKSNKRTREHQHNIGGEEEDLSAIQGITTLRSSYVISNSRTSESTTTWPIPLRSMIPPNNPTEKEESEDDKNLNVSSVSSETKANENTKSTRNIMTQKKIGSKREMMSFALPALGIFLCAPLLSNIDNAFVGKTVGTAGLAALSPATVCIDEMLNLFSFISRATTGIVSRAYSSGTRTNSNSNSKNDNHENDIGGEGNIAAAREVASTPLTFAIGCGIFLSIFYALLTPKLLAMLNVDPILRPPAASYVYWRGAIATAALVQSVCLSTLLATRDAITPLKIVILAAVVNVVADSLLCVYPFRWGCAGAAAATAFATLFSCGKMLMDLSKKKLLPQVRVPKLADLKELLEYVGPLFVLVISRLIGIVSMQRRAMTFGTDALAAYQICINTMTFFFLFGEPLSQLHQTKLPAFLDAKDKKSTSSTMKSVLTLACITSIGVGLVTLMTLAFGTGIFTADPAVQKIVKNVLPAVTTSVMSVILSVTFDGAMLASRDFNFIIVVGILETVIQLMILPRCMNLSTVFLSFLLRQIVYIVAVVGRIAAGKGALGKVLMAQDGCIIEVGT